MQHNMSALTELKAQSKSVLLGFFTPTITALVALHPEWLPCWLAVSGFWGSLFFFKQEEINDLVEFISNNPEAFAKEIVETDEFRGGFVVHLEAFLKERIKRKRTVLLKILKGFACEKDKESFQLERLNNVTSEISLESLEHVIFLSNTVLPQIRKEHQENEAAQHYSFSDYHAIHGLRVSLAKEENPLYQKKVSHADIDNLSPDVYEELFKLGILNRCHKGGLYPSLVNYYFSSFGFKFLDFVKKNFNIVK